MYNPYAMSLSCPVTGISLMYSLLIDVWLFSGCKNNPGYRGEYGDLYQMCGIL